MLKPEHENQVKEIWNNLLDFYYRNTNQQEWESFLWKLSEVERIKAEITGCNAALGLIELMDDRGLIHLKKFGIRATEPDMIRSAIRMKETNLMLAENKLLERPENDEAFNVYRVLAGVEYQAKRNIDIEHICLAHWVEILRGINERNKAEQEAYEKMESKRRV